MHSNHEAHVVGCYEEDVFRYSIFEQYE
jgi:hypothetical protein